MKPSDLYLYVIISFLTSVITKYLIPILRKKGIVAIPNSRSSHSSPTSVGGGIALLITIIPALIYMDYIYFTVLIAPILILGIVSFIDDIKDISILLRFLLQIIVVFFCIQFAFEHKPFFSGRFPPALDFLAAGLFWVGFINVFNFMDGIDGLTSIEIFTITLGVILIGLIFGLEDIYLKYALIIASATLGFFYWNWHPAKIFMGDVGSITMGFLLGWLLLKLMQEGFLVAAFILPLYYFSDSGFTILRRMFQGKPFWKPHREYFFQKAAKGCRSHSTVSLVIFTGNILLVGWALFSKIIAWVSIVGAVSTVLGLILILRRLSKN